MSHRIYVASSWRNEHQPRVVAMLRDAGHQVYDFRKPHIGPGAGGDGFSWDAIAPNWQDWSPGEWREALDHPVAADGFTTDLTGMEWADVCVLVLPSGRSAHAEAGWMAGAGKLVLAYVPERVEPDLMYLLFHGFAVTETELTGTLLAWQSTPPRISETLHWTR